MIDDHIIVWIVLLLVHLGKISDIGKLQFGAEKKTHGKVRRLLKSFVFQSTFFRRD
jgi:hypothetical protein